MTITLNGDTGITQSGLFDSNSDNGFKNRIINGAMVIDQRNNGAEINPAVNTTYYLDRWLAVSFAASKFKIGQNAGAVTPPSGFANYLGCTSLSAYAVGTSESFNLQQRIEGFNVADLNWGTASAATVTLSFWVYSSLTGTFGGAIKNSGATRSYPFSYSVSVANTWTQVSVVIPGDTAGTWSTTNGIGMQLLFSLGTGATLSGTSGTWAGTSYNSVTGAVSVVGTSGATFYITGVQLEKGSVATGFDYRSYGAELALCQRYYYKTTPSVGSRIGMGFVNSTTVAQALLTFPVSMRTPPSALEQSGTASNYSINAAAGATVCSAVPTFSVACIDNANSVFTVASGLTAGQSCQAFTSTGTGYLAWSAEL